MLLITKVKTGVQQHGTQRA